MIDIQHVMKYARRTENPRVGGSIPPLGTIQMLDKQALSLLGKTRIFRTNGGHVPYKNRHILPAGQKG